MKITAPFLILLLISLSGFSQSGRGNVQIIQSSDIEALIYKHPTFINEIKSIDGYRIQILSTTKLPEAEQSKIQFVMNFDSIPAYIDFNSPYYKMKVGNFQSRIDAFIALNKIREIYSSAFIVKDRVRLLEIR